MARSHIRSVHYHSSDGGMWLWIIALVAVGALAYTALTPKSTTLTTGPTSASCSNVASGFPKIQEIVGYLDPTNAGKFTQVGVVTNVTISGQQAPVDQSITSATAAIYESANVPCGASGTIFFGDSKGTAYYTYPVAFPPIGPGITQVTSSNMQKTATLSSETLSNSTNLGVAIASTVTCGKVVTAGGTCGPITLTLYTGAGEFGENGTTITLVYNGLAVSNSGTYVASASGTPLPTTSYALPSAANVVAGTVAKSFLAPPLTNWNTPYNFQIVLQTASGIGANTAVGIYINDQELFYNNGAATVQSVNPITGADLGQVGLDFGTSNTLTAVPGFGTNTLQPNPILICIAGGCK